jgi:transcription antitermination factor NusG
MTPTAPSPDWQPGQRVRIRRGPFANFVGTLVELVELEAHLGKVRVELSIFTRPVKVELDKDNIEEV